MPSGRPDWFGTIVAAGKYDTTYIPIALDVDGFITATMKGLYDAVLKTIAVDSSGIMKANISVQDLDQLVVRMKYGAAQRKIISTTAIKNDTTNVLTITDKGTVYWGYLYVDGTVTHNVDSLIITVDGAEVGKVTFINLYSFAVLSPYNYTYYCTVYNDIDFIYGLGIGPHITFEGELKLDYENATAEDVVVSGHLVYATI